MFDPSAIIYEDNHLIAVNKFPSQIVQGDKTGDIPLSELIKAYLKERDHKPGRVYLGVTHRLDRPVSGVVLFAKTEKALGRINQQIRERQVSKTYWAIVGHCPPEKAGILVHFLRKNEVQNKSYPCSEHTEGALEARLEYQVLAHSDRYHLLGINLITGRHHQIRAQLAAIGCPIKGDLKYGFPRSNPDASISLHSRSFSLTHPTRLEPLTLWAPPPQDSLWNALALPLLKSPNL